jgi:plasmid stabilization system protein ParE
LTYRVTIRPLARADIHEACTWYDEQQIGLGDALREALGSLVSRIADAPLSFPRVRGERRGARVGRLPYAVYFYVEANEVIVVAVMHDSRHPDRWRSRG